MKQFLFLLLLIFSFRGIFIPSVPSPEKDEALEQWIANLDAICEFKVTEEYPNVILELFDQLIERDNAMTANQRILHTNLQSIKVYGTAEEFCVIYVFSGELEYDSNSGSVNRESFSEVTRQVRMRQKDKTTYELVAQGGGPIAYGLEQTDLAIEDIE